MGAHVWVRDQIRGQKCRNERHGTTVVPRGTQKKTYSSSRKRKKDGRGQYRKQRGGRKRGKEDEGKTRRQAGIEKDATIARMNKTKQTSVWDNQSDTNPNTPENTRAHAVREGETLSQEQM